MTVSLALAGLTLRAGLEMRRQRRRGARPRRQLIVRHLRLAKATVLMLAVGFAGGPISALWLRDWTPFQTLHAWIGISTATLFAGAAWMGRRLERGRTRKVDVHGWLGLLAVLAAALAALAGFVLLP